MRARCQTDFFVWQSAAQENYESVCIKRKGVMSTQCEGTHKMQKAAIDPSVESRIDDTTSIGMKNHAIKI